MLLYPAPAVSIPANRRFVLRFEGDAESFTMTGAEYLAANEDDGPEEHTRVAALHVGESVMMGGGAGVASTITRVEDADVSAVFTTPHPYKLYCSFGDHIYEYQRQRCSLRHPMSCLAVCASVDRCPSHHEDRPLAVRA